MRLAIQNDSTSRARGLRRKSCILGGLRMTANSVTSLPDWQAAHDELCHPGVAAHIDAFWECQSRWQAEALRPGNPAKRAKAAGCASEPEAAGTDYWHRDRCLPALASGAAR